MSSNDDRFLAQLAAALHDNSIDAIVVGNTASILNGATVLTQDVDLLVRDTPINRRKLKQFALALGGAEPLPVSEMTSVERIYGTAVPIDIMFDRISGNLTFASVKSRAHLVPAGTSTLLVASLADIIRSKTAAGRPKDRAVLPLLHDTLRVRQAAGLEGFRANVRKAVTERVVDRSTRKK